MRAWPYLFLPWMPKRFRPVPVCPSMRTTRNRQRTGGFTGPIRLNQQGRFAGQQVSTCSGPRACHCAGRLGRPPRGAQAALKRPAAGSDRSEQEGHSSTGPMPIPSNGKDPWPSLHAGDVEARLVQRQHLRFRACPCRRMMQRSLVAMLQFTEDPLLHRQPAVDHVEFAPTLEGEAIDELMMASTNPIGGSLASGLSPSSPAFRARSDLPGQTFQMPLDFSPDDDCFRQPFRSADVDHGHPPSFASR